MHFSIGVRLQLLLSLLSFLWTATLSQSYDDVYNLEQLLYKSSNYSTTIRPLSDQTQKVIVEAGFDLVTLVSVDEVNQQFTVNGFLILRWMDERLQWDPADHNGIMRITPNPVSTWRPRLILMNTLDERDLFEDDYAPFSVNYDGYVDWFPGGLFPATCTMDLRKFPLDEHDCNLNFLPMMMFSKHMTFKLVANETIRSFFRRNGEWSIKETSLLAAHTLTTPSIPILQISLKIVRKPEFFSINILLPVVVLGMLNVLVFAIPVDSGEKISYSISVLLAFSVYAGVVSGFLPTNSEDMPYLIVYIFILFSISVLCCLDTILIVYLNHKEEKNEKKQNRDNKLRSARTKLGIIDYMKRMINKRKTVPDDSSATSTPPGSLLVPVDPLQPMQEKGADMSGFQNESPNSSSNTFLEKLKFIGKTKVGVEPENTLQPSDKPPRKKIRIHGNLAQKVNNYSFAFFILVSIFSSSAYLSTILS